MNQVLILNIGLSRNDGKKPNTAKHCLAQLERLGFCIESHAIISGEWEGTPEYTLHVTCNAFPLQFDGWLESLAITLGQDAIAYALCGLAGFTDHEFNPSFFTLNPESENVPV